MKNNAILAVFKHYICTFSLYFQISYAPHIKSCHRYKWAPFAQDLHFTSSEMEKSRGHLRGRAVTLLVRTPGTTSWTTVLPVAPTRRKSFILTKWSGSFFLHLDLFLFKSVRDHQRLMICLMMCLKICLNLCLKIAWRYAWRSPEDMPEDIPICLKIARRYAWR